MANDSRSTSSCLAAGANPFIPPIPGSDREGVTSLRTVQDADYLLGACEAGARCVCIGGGILGLETAGALARRGAKVTLLEGHGWLLPRQLNQRAGEILGDHVCRIGITLRNKAVTREILGDGRVHGVLLEDGSTIPADLVVIATGIRANSSLAQQAGLEVKHGVVVNNHLTTSHPDVLAAGDVAEHKGVVYGLWTASQAQGTIAGRNLAGASAEFGGLPRSNTLKVLGLDMFSIGQIMPEDASFQVIDQETGRPILPLCLPRESPGGRDPAGRHAAHVRHEEGRRGETRLFEPPASFPDGRGGDRVFWRNSTVETPVAACSSLRRICPVRGDRPCHGARRHGFVRVPRVRLRLRREQGGPEVERPAGRLGLSGLRRAQDPRSSRVGARSAGTDPDCPQQGLRCTPRLRLRLPGDLRGAHVADGAATLELPDRVPCAGPWST